MYSVKKCCDYITEELGLTIEELFENSVICYRFETGHKSYFGVDKFIYGLNKGDSEDDIISLCSDEFNILVKILFRNREKFRCELKYDYRKCAKFLENLGYKFDQGKTFSIAVDDLGEFVGDLRDVVDYLNDEYCGFLIPGEIEMCKLLKKNKDKVVSYYV